MASSGTTLWTVTALDVVYGALINELGVYGFGEDVDAEAGEFGLAQLNALLKSAGGGAHLETQGTITFTGGTASVVADSGIESIVSARYVSGTSERPLVRFERDEYLSLPNKAAVGAPTCFHVSDQRDGPVMYIWPVPATDTVLNIDYRRVPETVTNLQETVDFPSRYIPALTAMLATRCAGRFRINPAEVPELFSRAQTLWREMQDDERPASYMLGPY